MLHIGSILRSVASSSSSEPIRRHSEHGGVLETSSWSASRTERVGSAPRTVVRTCAQAFGSRTRTTAKNAFDVIGKGALSRRRRSLKEARLRLSRSDWCTNLIVASIRAKPSLTTAGERLQSDA